MLDKVFHRPGKTGKAQLPVVVNSRSLSPSSPSRSPLLPNALLYLEPRPQATGAPAIIGPANDSSSKQALNQEGTSMIVSWSKSGAYRRIAYENEADLESAILRVRRDPRSVFSSRRP